MFLGKVRKILSDKKMVECLWPSGTFRKISAFPPIIWSMPFAKHHILSSLSNRNSVSQRLGNPRSADSVSCDSSLPDL